MKVKNVKLIGVLVVAALVLCIAAVATQQLAEGEREVSMAEVPEAVKATVVVSFCPAGPR